MSGKASAVAIIGLSAVCLGLLWNQNGCPKAGVAPVSNSSMDGAVLAPDAEKNSGGIISVSSQDNRMFVADEYVVHVRIAQRDKNKNKAFDQLSESRDKILALFKKLDIAEKDFEQSSVKVDDSWEYVKDKRVKSGFIAKQVFNVQLNSKESVDALQQEFTLLPFVESAETSARLKNADSLEVETIKGACKKAMERADEYAHSVGTKAGKAFMVEGMSGVNEFNSSDSVGVYASMKVSMGISGKKSPEKSYIKVYQSESQKFVADKFLVTAEISVDGKDKEPLYKTIAEKRVALETLAKDLGVAASEIECLSLSIGKKSEWAMRQPENAGKPFKASQKIQVSFLSKEAAVAYFTALAHFENVMTESPAPTLINKDSLRVQVTRDAGKKALALARALAEGFGGKMGDVVRVGDSSSEGDDIQRSMALDDAVYEVSFEPVGKAGLAGLLGGGGSSMMNIADSVEIHSFISVTTELKY